MYYNDYARIRKIEKALEKLAYLSVLLDVFVAVSTYLVIDGGAGFSHYMLLLSGYLILAEVVLACGIFVMLVALKHHERVLDGIASITFKARYPALARSKRSVISAAISALFAKN